MSGNKPKVADESAAVAAFNERHEVGALVTVTFYGGSKRVTRTRSRAQLLSGGTPVIWLNGVVGCYALERVAPADGHNEDVS